MCRFVFRRKSICSRDQGLIVFIRGAFGRLFDFVKLKALLSNMRFAATTEKALA
jgi:hypothetical protein